MTISQLIVLSASFPLLFCIQARIMSLSIYNPYVHMFFGIHAVCIGDMQLGRRKK